MTVFMSNHAMDSAIDPRNLLPIALLPYVVLALMTRRARTLPALVISLTTGLATLVIGFWIYYDGLFVRFTTLNAPLFVEAPVFQIVVAAFGWAVVRWCCRRDQLTDETSTA